MNEVVPGTATKVMAQLYTGEPELNKVVIHIDIREEDGSTKTLEVTLEKREYFELMKGLGDARFRLSW